MPKYSSAIIRWLRHRGMHDPALVLTLEIALLGITKDIQCKSACGKLKIPCILSC